MRRKGRTALTSAGVAIGVGLIVALLSIAAGVHRTASQLIHIGRADFGLFQSDVADLTRSLLPQSLVGKVAKRPGVAQAAGIYLHVGGVQGRPSFLLFGMDPHQFPYRRLVITQGTRGNGKDALIGDSAASSLHLRPGDELHVGSKTFRISGVYSSGDTFEDSGAVLPLPLVARLGGHGHDVTTIAVVVKLGDTPEAAAHALEHHFPGLSAVTEPGQVVKVDTSSRLIISTGWVFSLLALIVGGIGVTNTMAMSVLERTREIGILRAVGWRTTRIAAMIVSESLAIGLLSLGLGLLLGYAGAELFTSRGSLSSLVSPDFTAGVFAWGLAFSLGVGVLGAVYPTWRATRLTPIEALRRE
jgi:putative ABC transport system permease protein